jgi:hypothetical protein
MGSLGWLHFLWNFEAPRKVLGTGFEAANSLCGDIYGSTGYNNDDRSTY